MKIVFFGDSVTEGCFEIIKENGRWELIKDPSSCFATVLTERLKEAYPGLFVESVNAGCSGDGTEEALKKIRPAVLDRQPDLVVFGFLLNDACRRNLALYEKNLRTMFELLKERGIPVVYLTPNMLNTYVSPETPDYLVGMAYDCADCENSGFFSRYVERGKEVASEYGFYVADVYAEWKKMQSYGIDTTALLCNHINHPSRRMHKLYADVLFEVIVQNGLAEDSARRKI